MSAVSILPKTGAASTQTSRATAFILNSPCMTPLFTGSFVPTSTKHKLEIDITHEINEPGSTSAIWTLYLGPSTTSPIMPLHQFDSLGTEVQKFRVGGASGRKVHIDSKLLVTGLTPGQTYNWELGAAGVGGENILALNGPWAVASAANITPFPEAANVVAVRCVGDGKIHLLKVQGFTDPAQITDMSSVTVTGATTSTIGRIALTADGKTIVSCQGNVGTVAVLQTNVTAKAAASGGFAQGTWQIGAPTYYTPPGTSPFPGGVTINAAGTIAYIVIGYPAGNQSSLYAMNTSTGVFTKVCDLGINAGTGDVVLTPDGLYALVGRATGFGIAKVRLSDGTIVAQSATGPASMTTIAVDSTGTYCYAASGQNLYKFAVSDLSTVLSKTSAISGASASPQRIAIHADGRSFWVAVQTATAGYQIQQFLTADLALYVNIQAHPVSATQIYGSDISIGPYAAVMIPAFWDGSSAANGALCYFPSGELSYDPAEPRPAGNYRGHDIRVLSTQLT